MEISAYISNPRLLVKNPTRMKKVPMRFAVHYFQGLPDRTGEAHTPCRRLDEAPRVISQCARKGSPRSLWVLQLMHNS